MPEVIDYRFRLRRALKATWTAINDVLFDGEIGWARDSGEIKVGDGATAWNSLPYLERGIHLDRLGDVDATAKSDGRILEWHAASGTHKYVDPPAGGGGGGRVLLYESTLASPGLFDTNDVYPGGTLPNGYRRFEIDAELRSTKAATSDDAWMFFNGDTNHANYREVNINGGATGNAGVTVADFAYCGGVCGNSSPAGYMAYLSVRIKSPGANNYKMALVDMISRWTATTLYRMAIGVHWESVNPITRIQLAVTSPATFAAGSKVTIWGIN